MANKYRVCGSMLKHNEIVSYIRQYQQKKEVLEYLYDFEHVGGAKEMMIGEIENYVNLIDQAITVVPEEFRKGVLEHMVCSISYDDMLFRYASRSTWDKWRKRFIDEVVRLRGEKEYCDILYNITNG